MECKFLQLVRPKVRVHWDRNARQIGGVGAREDVVLRVNLNCSYLLTLTPESSSCTCQPGWEKGVGVVRVSLLR